MGVEPLRPREGSTSVEVPEHLMTFDLCSYFGLWNMCYWKNVI